MKSRQPLTIEVTRGNLVESVHQVVCVVADRKGYISHFSGNVDYVVSPRSSIKPLQAIPFVESGALDHFQLSDTHLVLACASHKAEKHHLETLQEWLTKIGQSESVFRCGPAAPTKSPISHNCSGKHLGMITTALHLKIDPANYDRFEHPIQDLQRKFMSEIFNLDFSKLPFGGDGCGIPTYGVPLQKLALAMTLFVRDDLPEKRKRTVARILSALKKHPEFLSSEGDFVHKLIHVSQGRAIVKPGAEGSYTGILPEKGYAFALKVIDGNNRAAELASILLCQLLGGVTPQEGEALKEYFEPSILDSRGQKVGTIRANQGV